MTQANKEQMPTAGALFSPSCACYEILPSRFLFLNYVRNRKDIYHWVGHLKT